MSVDGNTIVLRYFGVQLGEADVDLLTGPFFLNDQIIEFYLRYLENRLFQAHPRNFLFVSPAVTQLIKMDIDDANAFLDPIEVSQKSVLFFPVNNEQLGAEGDHWSLLVYSRVEHTFFNFDSWHNSNRRSTNQLVDVLRRDLDCPDARLVRQKCHQQSNDYDCGICVLANIEKICSHFIRRGNVREAALLRPGVSKKRLELLSVIHQLASLSNESR